MEANPVGDPASAPARAPVVDTYVDRGMAAYLAELIGTFALVFFITMVVSLFVVKAPAGSPVQPFIDWSVIGLVHAFVLFMLVQTLAVVSGAHLNPAVTVALASIRQIRWSEAGVYIVLQFAGAILAALLTKWLLTRQGADVHYGAPSVSAALRGGVVPAAACEFVGTFFLVWAIVGVAVSPTGLKDWAGFAIGATLGLGVMVFGPLTGAGLNPARAFGPSLVAHSFDAGAGTGRFIVIYIVAPIVGAALASLAYAYLFTTPGKKGVQGMEPVG
jgi:MIP family channel proteins